MSRSSHAAALLAAALLAGAAALPTVGAVSPVAAAEVRIAATPDEAYSIAREGYEYLLPIVTMEVTRRVQTTVAAPGQTAKVPQANGFAHNPTFPPGDFRDIVRPNFDTLYSIAWIDVSKGPVVLSVKPGLDRYYLLPLMDMWTDVFAVPGTRTMGAEGGKFYIVSRGWSGEAPAGAQVIRAPTDTVWLIGRIQTNGPGDFDHVHKLQRMITLTPTVAAPTAPEVDPRLDRANPPARMMITMPADQFFAEAARLLSLYPPHDVDGPVLARLARIGFVPGKPFDLASLPPAVQAAIRKGAMDTLLSYRGANATIGEKRGTWRFQPGNLGAYGGDYRFRALVALGGLGANRVEDAIYPNTYVDSEGHPLTGANSYVLHFDKAQLPPAGAFWSVTAYDASGFPIQNPQNRFAVGDRDPLVYGADGSLDLYIGQKPPAPDKAANWLPTAADAFNLSLRIYLPKREVLDGRWTPPPVVRQAP